MVADVDLFSEASVPAGTSASGTPGSDGFTYRGAVPADGGDGKARRAKVQGAGIWPEVVPRQNVR